VFAWPRYDGDGWVGAGYAYEAKKVDICVFLLIPLAKKVDVSVVCEVRYLDAGAIQLKLAQLDILKLYFSCALRPTRTACGSLVFEFLIMTSQPEIPNEIMELVKCEDALVGDGMEKEAHHIDLSKESLSAV